MSLLTAPIALVSTVLMPFSDNLAWIDGLRVLQALFPLA
jgi:hypothetical protein